MLLGVHCFHGGHDLCELWPLCDCDCHAEKKLEAYLLETGPEETARVHERMTFRRYSREWRRAKRGTDPLFLKTGGRRKKRA